MLMSSFISVRRLIAPSPLIPVFALSLFLAALFGAGCGDEGDDTSAVTSVVQPATTPADTPETTVAEPAVEEPAEPVEEAVAAVSFQDDIQPILAERCATPGCHAAPGVAGLNLSEYDTFKAGGVNGPAFIAGDGKDSLVVRRIDGGGMPPGAPLDADTIQLFIDWIDEGAENN